jgi:hypothetical protein
MTVCTNYVALCNLIEHVVPIAAPNARRDPEFLVSQVVELQHHGIALAAVDAGMLTQEGDQELGSLFDQSLITLAS